MQKLIIITGARSGIGKTSTSQLINAGHIVYGVARRWAISCLVSHKQIKIGRMERYASPGSQSIWD